MLTFPFALVLAVAAEAPPPVTKVLVHPDAAIVTRTSEVNCGSEATSVPFHGLPAAIDPGSLRAAAGEGARVEGLSLIEHPQVESASPIVQELQHQLEEAQFVQDGYSRQISAAHSAKARAESLRDSARKFIEHEAAQSPKPDVRAWEAALEQTRKEIDDADKRVLTAETAQRDEARTIADIQRKLARLQKGSGPTTWDADVVVRCSGTTKVELSYLTPVARWTPAYEARADANAGTVALTVLAEVKQGTGEPWQDVDVTLSTALAHKDSQPPKPTRLYVSSYEEENRKKVLVARQEQATHVEGSNGAANAPGELQAEDQGISVQLHVPQKSDVAGDGRPARLAVETVKLNTAFDLVTMPKALPAVFHRAEAVNNARYPLLAGPLDLFDANGFLGTTRLERLAQGDKVKLAFGLDESVQVHRVVLEEEKKDPGFFTNRKLRYGYRFELQNTRKQPVTLEVQDSIPVSELDDVTVTISNETTPGYTLEKDDGLVKWKVPLQPGEKKNVDLRFVVEIPSKYDTSGL